MIKSRVIYVGVLGLSLGICYVKPSTAASLVAYTLIFLMLLSIVHVWWIYSKFTYTQSLDKKFLTKGDKVRFEFSTWNETPFFYPNLEVEFYGMHSVFMKDFKTKKIYVPARSQKTFAYEIECKYRGYYEIGIHKVNILDFLGLIRLSYKVMEPKVVTVYPRVVVLERFPVYPNRIEESEAIANGRWGMGNLTSDVREYVYGDSMRKVHWKLSAKQQSIMVKNEDSTMQAKVYVLLDLMQRGSLDIENRTVLEDQMIECVIAVLYYCLGHDIPTSFGYFQEQMRLYAAHNRSHFEELYEKLFKIKFEKSIPFSEVVGRLPTMEDGKGYCVGITSELDFSLYDQINKLVEVGNHVIIILVSLEEEETKVLETREIIRRALIKLGVVYYAIGVGEELSQILNS
ncbi:MAG: DUF58 domain-containing protein [Niameybacter sp.]|uniref:DUF58 domain-containing protein n=1 Tax=Niameybacter sp. TaxID=2033640 RepID=UPI002FCB4EC1